MVSCAGCGSGLHPLIRSAYTIKCQASCTCQRQTQLQRATPCLCCPPARPGALSPPAAQQQCPKHRPLTCAGSIHAAAITGPCGASGAERAALTSGNRSGSRGLVRPPPLRCPGRGDHGCLSTSPVAGRLTTRSKARTRLCSFFKSLTGNGHSAPTRFAQLAWTEPAHMSDVRRRSPEVPPPHASRGKRPCSGLSLAQRRGLGTAFWVM